jgi:hypothetical protein
MDQETVTFEMSFKLVSNSLFLKLPFWFDVAKLFLETHSVSSILQDRIEVLAFHGRQGNNNSFPSSSFDIFTYLLRVSLWYRYLWWVVYYRYTSTEKCEFDLSALAAIQIYKRDRFQLGQTPGALFLM